MSAIQVSVTKFIIQTDTMNLQTDIAQKKDTIKIAFHPKLK